MKALRTLVTTAAMLCFATAALAGLGPDIGVFFDDQGSENETSVRPFEQFSIYVVLQNIEDQVKAVEYKLTLPPELIVTNVNYGGPSPLAIGNPTDGFAIGLGGCVSVFNALPGSEKFVVETRQVYAFQHFDEWMLTLEPYQGPGQDPDVTSPRYADCPGGVWNLTPSAASVAAPVATSNDSWTAVKAMY